MQKQHIYLENIVDFVSVNVDCKVIKELDDYVMDNYATLGISYFGFDNILQPFELN